jgi:outer membrane receptor for ferrienterochelin and colicins
MRRNVLQALMHGAWGAVLFALLPAAALAQAGTGRVAGTVTDQQGTPVHGAQVVVAALRLGSITDARGRFLIQNVPAGSHVIQVRFIGYRELVLSDVVVRGGETTEITAQLEGTPVQLGGMVVSASRRAERITDAPATVTNVGYETIEKSVGPTWAGALKQVNGLDFIQVGAASVAINARGFNSSFNNRMLMMEDGRIAVLPENGLPVGQFTTMSKLDLEGVEVLVGPGAALYGPDASNGVVTLRSKDPRSFPGTTIEVTGGSRNFGNVQARHAQVFGNIGVKVTGEWQEVKDWENQLMHGANPETGVNGSIDWRNRVRRGQGSLVYYMNGDNRLEVSSGISVTDGVGQTNVGRNQLVGWHYEFQQAKLNLNSWFFNAYRARSRAGNSYALNRYTDNRANPANAGLSNEEVKLLSDWPSDGQLYAAEIQHHLQLPTLLNTQIVWGGQFRRDIVSSDRQWLTDRLTGKDLTIQQTGVYAQTTTPLGNRFNLVLASRLDDHENYDAQWSPKAGLIFHPTPDQAIRFTYNRAFKSPTTLQTDFHIPDWTAVVAIFGNTGGFTMRNAGGDVLRTYAPLRPEENQT